MTALVVALAVAFPLAFLAHLGRNSPGSRVSVSNSTGQQVTAGSLVPQQPGALVAGPDDSLYIADDGRNQILQWLPDGGYRVIAGNGRRGFSGDGGPAVKAELNHPGGIVVAHDGTVYFADTGNNRVRAISPGGRIQTVVGDGRSGWVASGTPALRADLGGPAAVAIGPHGDLYIAAEGSNEVLRRTPNGRLTRVCGLSGARAGVMGVGGAAVQASCDGPSGIAFDRGGDLFIAGQNTKTLLMVTPEGTMTLPAGNSGFYPRGDGGLVSTPSGTVLAVNGSAVVRLSRHGQRLLLSFAHRRLAGVGQFLPSGIAVSPTGAIYLDTDAGNGYATATAIVEIAPGGQARALWRS